MYLLTYVHKSFSLGILCWHFTMKLYYNVDRLLLLKGDALCSTNNASVAMSPLLEALTLAKKSHCILLASIATVHSAYVQASRTMYCRDGSL